MFADAVRECDARFRLTADAAHWMAILGMDQYGRLLGDLIPESVLVRTVARAAAVAEAGAVPVLLPHDLLRDCDPLPHSWSVTSDAIAAWVAASIGVPLLVLLKHGTALGLLPNTGEPSVEVSAAGLAGAGIVDAAFAGVLDAATREVWLLDGGEPQRLEGLLETGRTEGVRVAR